MNLGLEDKVVIVSGGAKDIGAATVKLFAKEKAIPYILDKDYRSGRKLVRDLESEGLNSFFYEVNLCDEMASREAVKSIATDQGRINVLINNAGTNDSIPLHASISEIKASLDRNLTHCIVLAQECWPYLKKSQGSIVNVLSKVAFAGQGKTTGYAASKGALAALTTEWAIDGLPYNLRVNAVVPAEVKTSMYKSWIKRQANPRLEGKRIRKLVPLGRRMTSPEEIANTIVFLASMRSSHTTGETISVDGGYMRLDRRITS